MKNIIITISLILALTASSLAGAKNAKAPVTPDPVDFADKLVTHFGGKDSALNKEETIEVLSFLQDHLPEKTGPSGLATRLNRERCFAINHNLFASKRKQRRFVHTKSSKQYSPKTDWFIQK